jgi:hypothetical protein
MDNRMTGESDHAETPPQPQPQPQPPSPWLRLRNWFIAAVVAGVAAAITTATTSLISSGGQKLTDAIAPAPAAIASATSTELPVAWTVSFASGRLNECHRWMFAKPIQDIPFRDTSAGDSQNLGLWALGQGGVDVGAATYTVTLQGQSDTDVVIRNLRIKVLSKKAALPGTTIGLGGGCGGTVSVRHYSVEIGTPNPQLMQVNAAGAATPSDEQYVVSKSDPEVFQLFATIGKQPEAAGSYTFVYQFDWSQGSRSGTVEITGPDGKPFGLTVGGKGPLYLSYNGNWTDLATIR